MNASRDFVDHTQNEINEFQRQINNMCGVDDDTFAKYGPQSEQTGGQGVDSASSLDETQRLINTLFGIEDESKQVLGDSGEQEAMEPLSETQRLINKLMGVDDETWEKYSPKGTPTK